jgi:hypothetical protein
MVALDFNQQRYASQIFLWIDVEGVASLISSIEERGHLMVIKQGFAGLSKTKKAVMWKVTCEMRISSDSGCY